MRTREPSSRGTASGQVSGQTSTVDAGWRSLHDRTTANEVPGVRGERGTRVDDARPDDQRRCVVFSRSFTTRGPGASGEREGRSPFSTLTRLPRSTSRRTCFPKNRPRASGTSYGNIAPTSSASSSTVTQGCLAHRPSRQQSQRPSRATTRSSSADATDPTCASTARSSKPMNDCFRERVRSRSSRSARSARRSRGA
jgi:hypothetical protein